MTHFEVTQLKITQKMQKKITLHKNLPRDLQALGRAALEALPLLGDHCCMPWLGKPTLTGGASHAHVAHDGAAHPDRTHRGHTLLPPHMRRVTTLGARGPTIATHNVHGV